MKTMKFLNICKVAIPAFATLFEMILGTVSPIHRNLVSDRTRNAIVFVSVKTIAFAIHSVDGWVSLYDNFHKPFRP